MVLLAFSQTWVLLLPFQAPVTTGGGVSCAYTDFGGEVSPTEPIDFRLIRGAG